ncbi:AAA family ATPase [Spirosoma linguale]|uniref:ATPase associated with various cellular activities AAA_5 n=1 Tax=Spirosoma linguale (strain ATCC 33905 / DSM 74 / LMG 10896 / Claus 1) TaxID=504472 RepID=D2QG43_SPILD|nr:ATPase associated with various cellular activities AAA_5 [Spirosoma linguale DSM 74]
MPLTLRRIPVDLKPANYLMDSRLQRAVELAIALDKPLLVSGEPGTGKTQLARHVASVLAEQTRGAQAAFLPEPIEFYTKSTASASDLFYSYDAVSHFRSKEQTDTSAFMDFTALGRARVLAHGRQSESLQVPRIQPLLDRCAGLADGPRSSVVLIDEVDKAPREFPNDLLNEMESGEFRIRELNFSLKKAQNDARVVVILTSNFEKSLPNAFLRRCVFYHIPFPDDQQLLAIVDLRLGLSQSPAVREALRRFRAFRDQAKQSSARVPSTAEFLDWLRVLNADGLLTNGSFPPDFTHANRPLYESSLVVLQKDGLSADRTNPLLA